MSTENIDEKLPSYNETQVVSDHDPPRYNATANAAESVSLAVSPYIQGVRYICGTLSF